MVLDHDILTFDKAMEKADASTRTVRRPSPWQRDWREAGGLAHGVNASPMSTPVAVTVL
jgi:hypothetical protein